MVDPDPVDRAYSQAESLLQEQAERSARRARVLDAVAAAAQDTVTGPVSPPKSMPRFATRGGWLVAASLLVVSGFLVARFLPLNPPSPPMAQVPAAQPAAKTEKMAALSPEAPAASAITPSESASSRSNSKASDQAPAREPAESSREQLAVAAPPPAMAAPPPAAPEAIMAPPPPVPAARMAAPPAAPAPMADMAKAIGEAGNGLVLDQLRAAAAAGRMTEVQELLDRQIPVDGADTNGETALMKSIRAGQPATAALLLRHGASLDKKNKAGLSARELAAQINDPALNRALGLER